MHTPAPLLFTLLAALLLALPGCKKEEPAEPERPKTKITITVWSSAAPAYTAQVGGAHAAGQASADTVRHTFWGYPGDSIVVLVPEPPVVNYPEGTLVRAFVNDVAFSFRSSFGTPIALRKVIPES